MDIKSSISKREKTIFAITLFVIILSILYSFVMEPLYRENVRLNQEISIKQTRLLKYLKLIKEKDLVRGEFKKYSYRLKTRNSEEEEMAFVLSEIERIGKSTGISLRDVKPQKNKNMDFYKVILVEIRYQANMQTLSKFIYDLQNSSLLLKVNRLQINSMGGDSALLEGVIQISKTSIS